MKTLVCEKMAWFWAVLMSFACSKRQKLASERGDTNFISILIILAIVVVLSGVFIGFKDQIIGRVEELLATLDIH